MNLPNKLTISRIIMIPIFVTLFFVPFPWHKLIAMVVFALASVTDFLDGYIARRNNLVTNLGKFLDPIADKMLVACALITICVTEPVCPFKYEFTITVAVLAMVILSRELMISGFRIIAADKNIVLAADMAGKWKTFTQMVAICCLLPADEFFSVNELCGVIIYYIGFSLLAVATLLALISAVHYVVKNKVVLEG